MCGICGELRFDGASPDADVIKRMSEKMAGRGPDHSGTFTDGPLALVQDGARLRFASSLQALLDGGGIDTWLDAVALHHHFTLHTVGTAQPVPKHESDDAHSPQLSTIAPTLVPTIRSGRIPDFSLVSP